MTIALLQPHLAIQDPGFLTEIKISHDYEGFIKTGEMYSIKTEGIRC